MTTLVLIRHGQSQWNKENRFTGWVNVELAQKGIEEAKQAGKLLKEKNYTFDVVFTSSLKRAQQTAKLVLENMQLNLKPIEDWHLNERHYGALAGKNKKETAEVHGAEQVHIWRRSYATRPPELSKEEAQELVKGTDIPAVTAESLKDTVERVVPYWSENILPDVMNGKKILIAAHGNSLRGLMKHLFNISDDDITSLEIPTGVPIICELDENFIGKKYTFLE